MLDLLEGEGLFKCTLLVLWAELIGVGEGILYRKLLNDGVDTEDRG